ATSTITLSVRLGWMIRGDTLSDNQWFWFSPQGVWMLHAYTMTINHTMTRPLLPPLLPDQPLLDVLKRPGVGPDGRAAVVAEFGKRLKREFRHQWELAEYLEQHRPDLDVAAPLPPRK